MGSKPKDARSKAFGTAVIVEVPAVTKIATEKPLGIVDFGGGNTTVVPLGMFDQKERVIFIPAGNVASGHDFFDWLGNGRKRIVRKRKFPGAVSTGIVAPLDLLPQNYARYNDVRVGANVAKALGVYAPLPPETPKVKARTIRKRQKPKPSPSLPFVSKEMGTERAHFVRARQIIDEGLKMGAAWSTDGKNIYATEPWHSKASESTKRDLKTLKNYALKVLIAGPDGDPMRKEAEEKVLAGLNAQISGDMAKMEPMREIPREPDRVFVGPEVPKTPTVNPKVVALAKNLHESVKSFQDTERSGDSLSWEDMGDDYRARRFRQAKWLLEMTNHFDDTGAVSKFMKDHFGLEFPNIEAGVIGALLGLENSYKTLLEESKAKDKLIARLTNATKRYIVGTEFIGQQMDKINEKKPFDPWG